MTERVDYTSPESIRAFLGRHEMSQRDLARAVGCSHSAAFYWATGQRHPTGLYAARLREVMRSLDGRAAVDGKGGGR